MSNSCVKNVNCMFIISSINSDNTSTNKLFNCDLFNNWVQKLTTKQVIQFFTSIISTTKNSIINLLNNSFTHNPHSLLLRLKNKFKERY